MTGDKGSVAAQPPSVTTTATPFELFRLGLRVGFVVALVDLGLAWLLASYGPSGWFGGLGWLGCGLIWFSSLAFIVTGEVGRDA